MDERAGRRESCQACLFFSDGDDLEGNDFPVVNGTHRIANLKRARLRPHEWFIAILRGLLVCVWVQLEFSSAIFL